MRRSLVITDESARHPYRASLPPFLRRQLVTLRRSGRWPVALQDAKEFLMAYCACFLAISLYFS